MADYWKSIDKKYCDTCKCWITDNRSSVEFHESGRKHQANVQNRLRDIQKKAREDNKHDRKFDNELRKIEKAAQACYYKDKADNPDFTLQVQNYIESQNPETLTNPSAALQREKKPTAVDSSQAEEARILHRSEAKKSKREINVPKVETKSYNSKGGWSSNLNSGVVLDLELPKSKAIIKPIEKIEKMNDSETKKSFKMTFSEKTISSSSFSSGESSSSTLSSFIKNEPKTEEVAFKKRKFSKSNARKAINDEEYGS